MEMGQATKRVTGIEFRVVQALMVGNLWWIGVKLYKNPIKAFRIVKRLLTNYKQMMGGKTLVRAFKINGKYAWDLFNPSWPSKGFNSFFERHLIEIEPLSQDQRALRRLIVAITKRCPLSCAHCSEAGTLYQKDILSLEEYSQQIDAFVTQGVSQLIFSGGEPLSRFEDLISLIFRYRNTCDQWVYTSGFGLTQERAQQLKKAGLNGIAISLDHFDPTAHNAFRGNQKSHEWVEQSVEFCLKEGILVVLNVCPTRELIDQQGVEKIVEWAKEKGVPMVNILEPRAVGNYQDQDVSLFPEHMEYLWRLSERYNFDRKWLHYPTVLFPAGYRKHMSCGGGKSYLFFDFDGRLYPCPFCKSPIPKDTQQAPLCEAVTA